MNIETIIKKCDTEAPSKYEGLMTLLSKKVDIVRIPDILLSDAVSQKNDMICCDYDILANFRDINAKNSIDTICFNKSGSVSNVKTPSYYICNAKNTWAHGFPTGSNIIADAYVLSATYRYNINNNIFII